MTKKETSVWNKLYSSIGSNRAAKVNLARIYLAAIGDNPKRSGLKDTPERMVRMWDELFSGNTTQPPKITVFKNGSDGIAYDEMIIDTGYFYSTCEHHTAPFFGQYYFGYIPGKKILGLSKVARVVEYFSHRLQVQERLANDIVDYIEKQVKPKGIAISLEGRHLCKEMRGVKQRGGKMITNVLRGAFKKHPAARSEFLHFAQNGK